jgi:hypothetical protein
MTAPPRPPLPLPPFAALVEYARANPEVITFYPDDPDAPEITRLACLDQYEPAIETLRSREAIARWVGIRPASVSAMRARGMFPAASATFGRSSAWSPRAVVEHYAARPGRGNRTAPGTETARLA